MHRTGALATIMLVAFAATYALPSYAQQESGGPPWSAFESGAAFVGRTPSMGPNCGPIEFHVVPTATTKNQLTGVAFEGAPGTQAAAQMKVYSITGTLSDDGKVDMDLKPLAAGTPIKVNGTFKMGMLMASIAGRGTCHSSSFMLMPVAMPTPPPSQ